MSVIPRRRRQYLVRIEFHDIDGEVLSAQGWISQKTFRAMASDVGRAIRMAAEDLIPKIEEKGTKGK